MKQIAILTSILSATAAAQAGTLTEPKPILIEEPKLSSPSKAPQSGGLMLLIIQAATAGNGG